MPPEVTSARATAAPSSATLKIILMDEPLSNFDAQLPVEMRNELVLLQSDVGSTMLYAPTIRSRR